MIADDASPWDEYDTRLLDDDDISLARAEARAELLAAEEYVMLDGLQLPYYSDLSALRALDAEMLREHALKLYRKLGHAKIGTSVPTAYDELVDWVWRVQGMHLDPLRGVGGSLARAELRAELRAAEYVMLDGLQLPYYSDLP